MRHRQSLFVLAVVAQLSCATTSIGQIVTRPTGPLPTIDDSTPLIQKPSRDSIPRTNSASITRIPVEILHVDLPNWEDDHLHWQAPSTLLVFDTGRFEVYAAHLANMKRVGELQDVGTPYSFELILEVRNGEGQLVWADYLTLNQLYYKSERNSVRANLDFPDAVELLKRPGHKLIYQQQVRPVLSDAPPPRKYRLTAQ